MAGKISMGARREVVSAVPYYDSSCVMCRHPKHVCTLYRRCYHRSSATDLNALIANEFYGGEPLRWSAPRELGMHVPDEPVVCSSCRSAPPRITCWLQRSDEHA